MNLKCIHCGAVVDPDVDSMDWPVAAVWCPAPDAARHFWGAIDADVRGPEVHA